MSTLTGSRRSARSSAQLQRRGLATAPEMEKSHRSSGVRGVGPAERIGKSRVSYWPGGTRSGAAVGRRRPTNPRETNRIAGIIPSDEGGVMSEERYGAIVIGSGQAAGQLCDELAGSGRRVAL